MSGAHETPVMTGRDRLPWRVSAPIGAVGAIVVPILLALVFNSYGPPGPSEFVRKAFASVAGSVVAVATMTGLVVASFVLKSRSRSTLSFFLLVTVAAAASSISNAAELLLQRLA